MDENPSDRIEQKLYDILTSLPIIQKLKSNKGGATVKKMVQHLKLISLKQQEAFKGFDEGGVFLLLIVQGFLEVRKKMSVQQSIANIIKIKPKSYYVVQRNGKNSPEIITSLSESKIFMLQQRYFCQFFEGIIQFPFVAARIKQLRNNIVFSSMQPRKLSKIAFALKEVVKKIGNKLQVEEIQEEQVKKYAYLILEGEIKLVLKNQGICVLGPYELLGSFSSPSSPSNCQSKSGCISQGVVTTEYVRAFKIPSLCLEIDEMKNVEYENKRTKWRENRLSKITRTSYKDRQESEGKKKLRASFVDKQIVMKSVYGEKMENLIKLKESCKVADMKCQTRQEFYCKKLSKLQQIQKKRYGPGNKTVVLFPIPLSRAFRKFGVTQLFGTPQATSKKKMRRSHTESLSISVSPLHSIKKNESFLTSKN